MFGEFWNFTWWEMGSEDLPAAMNYILGVSNQTQWVSPQCSKSPVWVCFVKIANTGPRPGYDGLLRDAGPTPRPGQQDIPHHLNGSHNLWGSHHRLTAAVLSLSDLAAPLVDGWSQKTFLPFNISLLAKFISPSLHFTGLPDRQVLCGEFQQSGPLLWPSLLDIRVKLVQPYLRHDTSVRFDEEQQNKSDLTKQLQHFPAGTSARTIVHTAQNIQQGGW